MYVTKAVLPSSTRPAGQFLWSNDQQAGNIVTTIQIGSALILGAIVVGGIWYLNQPQR